MSIASVIIHNCTYVLPETPRTRLDGDTFRCQGVVKPIVPDSEVWIPKVRVVRINAPETGTPGAEEARTALITWLQVGAFHLVCYARDKYGRLLADAGRDSGELLSQYMLDSELAKPMSLHEAVVLLPQGSYDEMARAIAHHE